MKKIVISILTIILITLAYISNVYAAQLTATFTITPDKTVVESGDKVTFTMAVTNVQNAENDIGAIGGNIDYDKDFFELQQEESDISVTTDEGEYKGDFIKPLAQTGKIVLKVKDGVTGSSQVKFTDLKASDGRTDETLDTEGTARGEDQTITITIADTTGGGENPNPEEKVLTKIKIDTAPTKVEYVEGEKFDKTGMKVSVVYSDGTTKEITNYTYTPNGKLTEKDLEITITYTEGGVTKTARQEITVKAKDDENPDPAPGGNENPDPAPGGNENLNPVPDGNNNTNSIPGQEKPSTGKDTTVADIDIPKAGINVMILIVAIGVSIVAVVMYKKNQSFKDIK